MGKRRYGNDVMPDERAAVHWFSFGVLWKVAVNWLFAAQQQRQLDKRETFHGPWVRDLSTGVDRKDRSDDFWFDFVSDTGDGGNATYSVALGLAQDHLTDGATSTSRRLTTC